jgi:hypothetical protein
VKGKGQLKKINVNGKKVEIKNEVEDGKEKERSNNNGQLYYNTVKRKFML